MRIVCTISTGLQLINSFEYIFSIHGKIGRIDVIILSDENRTRQIKSLINLYSSSQLLINVLTINSSKSVANNIWIKRFILLVDSFKRKRLIKRIISQNNYNLHICGNYLMIDHRYALNRGEAKKKVCVDDGLAALDYFQCRKNRVIKQFSIASIFYGVIKDRIESLTFFSVYNLKVLKEDFLQHNSYKNTFKHLQSAFNINADCMFIGQPLLKYLSSEISSKLLITFARDYNINKIQYVLHPSECQIQSMNEAIKQIRLEYPIELYIASIPKETIVAGFYSSALFTIKKMRPELKVYSIDISDYIEESERSSNRASLKKKNKEMYGVLERIGIETIRINL